MQDGDVVVSVAERVAELTMSRPARRNALSVHMTERFHAALDAVEDAGDDARVVLLHGEAPAFCAGADFGDFGDDPDRGGFLPMFQDLLDRMAHFRIPFVAAVVGPALGAGCQVLAACDLRVVAQDCAIGVPGARIGLQLDVPNLNRLVCEFGPTAARRLLLTGEPVSGAEALHLGIVHEAVPVTEVAVRARHWADIVAARAPLSVQGHKSAVQSVVDRWWLPEEDPDHHRHSTAADAAFRSADLAEGLAAFTEKRPPHFHGR